MLRYSAKILFFGVVFIFFSNIVFSQESELLKITSPKSKQVNSNEFFAAPFILINNFSKAYTFNLKVTLPEDWSLVSKIDSIVLDPGKKRRVFMNIYVPPTAISEVKYRITLRATSLDESIDVSASFNVEIVPQISVEVSVLEQDRKKTAMLGEVSTGTFYIRNTGNKKEIFKIKVGSSHNWPTSLEQTSIELKPSESRRVSATVSIPKKLTSEINQNLKLTAISSSDEDIFDSKYITINVIPMRKGKLYETAKVKLKNYLSAIGTGTLLAPQVEVDVTGEIYKGYNFYYWYQGPRFKNRVNYKRIASEQFLTRLSPKQKERKKDKEDSWYIEAGDITSNFTELLLASRSGRGSKLHYHEGILTTNFTYDKHKVSSGYFDYFYAGDVGIDITPKIHSKVTYIQNNSNWIFTDESPQVKNKRMASILNIFKPFKPLTITYEYGMSHLSRTSTSHSENKQKAYQLTVNLSKPKFKQTFEYVYAGSFFAGAKSDSKLYYYYTTYKPLRWFSSYLSLRRNQDNTDRDLTKPINTSYQGEAGSNITLKPIGTLDLSLHFEKSKDKGQNADKDSKIKYVRSRISRGLGPWFRLSVGVREGKNDDYFNSIFKEISDYDARLNFTGGRLRCWMSYDRKKQKDIQSAELEKNVYRTVGLSYLFADQNISINGMYIQDRTKADTNRRKNSFLANVRFKPNKDFEIKFEFEKKDVNIGEEINGETMGRWRAYLTVTSKFDAIIPWRKVGTSLKGTTFIDKNRNYIFDEGDVVLAKVGMVLKKYKAKSNSSGKFYFKGLKPGEYEIYLDSTTYDISLAPLIEFPLGVTLLKGKVSEVNIPFSVTAKMIEGIIFSDPERTGEYSEDKNGLVSIRLDLIDEKGEIFRSTSTTDGAGRYFFANIAVGKYKLRVNSDWLKKGYVVVNNREYEIELKEGETKSDLNFGIAKKERPIKRTFIQSIDKEEIKKEEPPKELQELPKPPKVKDENEIYRRLMKHLKGLFDR